MLTSSAAPATSPAIAPPPAPPPPTRAELARRMFTRSIAREHGFEPLRVEGALPPGLRGTLLGNGPGLFGQFGQAYAHSFEGDGLITGVRLDAADAHGVCRLTATAGVEIMII